MNNRLFANIISLVSGIIIIISRLVIGRSTIAIRVM